ncbi:MAG TPA: hypothetical protein VFE59_40045 [Trebonia sp.]|jgi:hypothetical protein|nr:hypothetical protein [Trebonia sp.]
MMFWPAAPIVTGGKGAHCSDLVLNLAQTLGGLLQACGRFRPAQNVSVADEVFGKGIVSATESETEACFTAFP